MPREGGKIDWSEDRWKDILIGPRKYFWPEETVERLAAWFGLEPGMVAVDVGCGLGYLGYTYWPHFGAGGRYIGVDESPELLDDAARAAEEWADGGEAHFVAGDCYNLPFPDEFADVAMCQTLLMHLEKPERALAEMARVVKPGGLVFCKEPDNVSSTLARSYSSLPDLSIDEELLDVKVTLVSHKGRIELGRGDNAIGARVPAMMKELGLTDVDVRMNDRVFHLEPPYEGPEQQHRIEMMRKFFIDDEHREYRLSRSRENYVAGGGTAEEFDKMVEIYDRIRPLVQEQLEAGEYFSCGGGFVYVAKGRK
ncbi:MAG: methyltransferase domain-containing protein [Candidatus Coatesbacteria bacterium]|nr:MAG: methyltransferase domain-containing protein [Candidatus Coatesbacteria bacterium]